MCEPNPSSRWARALGGEPAALRELAARYWYPVYAWWRRSGSEEPEGATLACFTWWLREAPPRDRDPGAGTLREWLHARLSAFGGNPAELPRAPVVEISSAWAESRFAQEPPGTSDELFERRWALTVLEHALQALRAEYGGRGEEALLEAVAPFGGFAEENEARYAELSGATGLTRGGARKAVSDFRARHREILRALVADTVADPAGIDAELTALLIASDGASAAGPLPTAIRAFKPDEMIARAMNSARMAGSDGSWQPPTDDEVARLFPQYEILGLLGRGGMGAVYKARQMELDRCVAIKLLPLEISADHDFAERFRREARAMAKLSHPHIIAVFDFGQTSEGHLFFVMEFVDGANLHELIHSDEPLPPAEALALLEQVCDALAYAHEKGVVHRDIKPANVMVEHGGRVKVADFGLARLTDSASAEKWRTTMTGIVMGTPDYMAPEQKRGLHVDHRADVYALGVTLYEALCLETPQGVFEPPSKRCGLDRRVDAIISKALASQPEARFQSTLEMKSAMASVRPSVARAQAKRAPEKPPLSKESSASTRGAAIPGPKSRWPLAVTVAIVLLLAGAAGWRWRQAHRAPVARGLVAESANKGTGVWQDQLKVMAGHAGLLRLSDGAFQTEQTLYLGFGAKMVNEAVRVRCTIPLGSYVELNLRKNGDDALPGSSYRFVIGGTDATILGSFGTGKTATIKKTPLPRDLQGIHDIPVELELRVVGHHLTGKMEGQIVCEADDETLANGIAGIVVSPRVTVHSLGTVPLP